jgi:hypothetical protein
MFRQFAKNTVLRALAWANAKAQADVPKQAISFRVAVTGAGEPQIEMVEADSRTQAAERAGGVVAQRRLKATAERSWRLTAIVDDCRFEVDVSCYLKAEVCGGHS